MSFSAFNKFKEKASEEVLDRVLKERIIKQNNCISELETEIEENKKFAETRIREHAKELANMLESISCLEDEKMEQSKVLSGIVSEINDFEKKISSLRAKKDSIETSSLILDRKIEDCDKKKRTIENNFEMWHNERKRETEALEHKLKGLKQDKHDNIEVRTEKVKNNWDKQTRLKSDFHELEAVGSKAGKLQILDFLTKSIDRYTANLECPICLTTAVSPIYQCSDAHLVCNKWRPKVKKCPECRVSYKEEYKRHRYAEREAEELENLTQERERLLEGWEERGDEAIAAAGAFGGLFTHSETDEERSQRELEIHRSSLRVAQAIITLPAELSENDHFTENTDISQQNLRQVTSQRLSPFLPEHQDPILQPLPNSILDPSITNMSWPPFNYTLNQINTEWPPYPPIPGHPQIPPNSQLQANLYQLASLPQS
jgi:hypothetical protein